MTYSSAADAMELALMDLENVDQVVVTKTSGSNSDASAFYTFTITFLSEFGDANPSNRITPIWSTRGCVDCTTFDPLVTSGDQITISGSTAMSDIEEQQAVKASDASNGARFGASVAIHRDQLVVSAVYSSGATTTTNANPSPGFLVNIDWGAL